MNSLPKADFVRLVQDTYHRLFLGKVSVEEAERMVDTVVESISTALVQGDKVTFYSFGSFTPKLRPSRMAHNPQTGELHEVESNGSVRLHLSPKLSARIKKGLGG